MVMEYFRLDAHDMKEDRSANQNNVIFVTINM
jgi:hypothetical protein